MASARASSEAGSVFTQRAHTLIIGAGPSGLAAAWRLAEAGLEPIVFERSPCSGGMMRSIRRGEFVVDLGRKELYSRIPEVDALWRTLLGDDYREYPHRVGSLYAGRIIEMSSSFRGVRRGMPIASFLSGGLDLGRAWLLAGFRKPRNYEEYWRQRAGANFARALAQGYWEKFRGQQWSDLPVPTLHADGQAARSYSFAAIADGVKLAAQGGASRQRGWRHPARGSGQICEVLMDRLTGAGGEVHFDSEVVGIESDGRRITGIVVRTGAERVWIPAANLISSLQIEQLVALLGGATGNAPPPRQRTVVLAYLFLDEAPRFPHAWLEVNDTSLNCGRITNYAAFGGDMVPPGRTALCVEFFLDSDDLRLDRSDAEWIRLAIAECAGSALIDATHVSDTMLLRLDRCNAAASWREAQEDARSQMLEHIRPYANLYHVNRPGTDWAMFAGLMAAESVLSDDRRSFDRRADPTQSYSASNPTP
ncbi:FAD-dependent oxidoreductase [Sphingomonas sp. SUN019]|uniref:FAD-dependent oxidoreductase n=1 Tax=Sphingomonas sp. SUN019 TaxID=2937788 RepID=UPI0021641A8B|nr:FAD-dependent oxidoreductase [Sphingomonas sp. SUN019]UVO49856.1 FAD-dependent oxidoreductase [Sphingomonas sp. SUN019]